MITKLSNTAVNFLLKRDIIKNDEKELYSYGLFILISYVGFFLVALLIGFILKIPFYAIIFYISFCSVRGFNQAELLARGVSGLTDIPFSDMLVKTIETKQQHNLKEFERSGNVLGAFDIKEECLPLLKGARVLLCDDVKTTGSTLNECAKTLLISGAEEVMCLTACIAQRENAEKPRGTEVRFVNEF